VDWSDDKVLKVSYAWANAFNWKMVKLAAIEAMESEKSEKTAALMAEV
jgi:hypothetical protein